MFDDVDQERFNELAKQTAFSVAAISQFLVAKGLATDEEIETHFATFQPKFDQIWEATTRDRNKRMLEDNPGMGLMAKMAGKEILLP